MAWSDSSRRSANDRSIAAVMGLGTATVKIPAAFAALIPLLESSNAMALLACVDRRSSATQ